MWKTSVPNHVLSNSAAPASSTHDRDAIDRAPVPDPKKRLIVASPGGFVINETIIKAIVDAAMLTVTGIIPTTRYSPPRAKPVSR